jgi:hypothetical protein
LFFYVSFYPFDLIVMLNERLDLIRETPYLLAIIRSNTNQLQHALKVL